MPFDTPNSFQKNGWPRRAINLAVLGFLLAPALLPARALAAETLISVDVALGDVSINKVPFLMAADNGIYERNGLDVHQFITAGAAQVARNSGVIVPEENVREDIGDAPIAVGGASPTIYRAVHSGGIDRVVLATHESVVKNHIIARPDIHSVEDLRGKRIGYSSTGTVTHMGLLLFAKKMGWTPGADFEPVERANAVSAVTEGDVDATMGSALRVALSPEAGLNDVVDLEEYNIPLAGSGVMAERSWLAANRDAAARFVKASVEAVALMKQDRAAFNASLAKWFNITDATTQERMYEAALEFPNKPYPAVEGISAMMELYDSPEMQNHSVEEFYDASFVEALDKEGYLDSLYK
jgi:NitT/TauT family transport system substrate-binding protein